MSHEGDPDRDRVRMALQLDWRSLGHVSLVEEKLKFPDETPKGPGVYRFSLGSPVEGDSVYIGEGVLLHKRFDWYRGGHKSQVTNKRMNGRMREVLHAGGMVLVDIATEIRLEVDGQPVSSNLSNAFQRKFAENAALVVAESAGEKIENRGKSLDIGV